jgi:hypothetical protein
VAHPSSDFSQSPSLNDQRGISTTEPPIGFDVKSELSAPVSSGHKSRISVLPLGVGTEKTGRNLTIVDRQPVKATPWSLTSHVAARCFLVGCRQLESSTTRGSGMVRPGPNRQTQVHRLDGITR